jgi:hypothetical protein
MQLGKYKIQGNDWPWPMPMDVWNPTHYMEYRQVRISLRKTYNTAYIKLWILGNKDPIMKMPYVNGVSSADITLFSATNLCDASYV